MATLDELADEDFFPGNLQALSTLQSELADGRLVAFVGSGISVPLAPSWSGLLSGLIDQGLREGLILQQDEALLRQQVAEDPLELAGTLEETFTTAKFRTILGESFRLNDKCTSAHELLVGQQLQGIFTLNYDDGLSTAFVRRFQRMPTIIRSDDRFELHRWMLDHPASGSHYPIVHWHGTANAPERMILTADDYDRYYGVSENKSFIEELWRGRRLFVVGFGFRDPILTRLAETVLRASAGECQHIALIGRRESEPLTPLLRRQFSKKFRINPVFYRIRDGADGAEDHSNLFKILEMVRTLPTDSSPSNKIVSTQSMSRESPRAQAEKEFKDGLFVGPNGQVLYVEPKIIGGVAASLDGELQNIVVSVRDIANHQQHTIVHSPLETGGTTLARRLMAEIIASGKEAIYREAGNIGTHKRKILEDRAFKQDSDLQNKIRVLIIDNFDVSRHDRTIKEIIGLKCFDRLIIISRTRTDEVTNLDDLGFKDAFQSLTLQHLDRADVRIIASQLYDTFDSDLVSAAVEKTYSDLLDLCIPLTPSNVIMYLSVVHREGGFTPLNRLHIMDRFIRDMLHRPSDLYRDAFNADNKLDVISAFIYDMFLKSKSHFNNADWNTFCTKEMKDSLIWFDKDNLIDELEQSRLIVRVGNEFFLKYKLFYSYFVGKFVAERPNLLKDFLNDGRHLSLDSLVEVIAGSSKDNTLLVTDLVARLEIAVSDFENQYELSGFDPYEGLEWKDTEDEKDSLWKPIGEKIASGPASDSEVDKLKRSIVAESRTENQNVVIREFSDYQRSVLFLQVELIAALRDSQKLEGSLKARSMKAIYQGYHIALQIGFLFAPIIATRRFFVWNDMAFYNHMNWPGYADAKIEEQASMIAGAVPRVIANKAADELGSRKLGALFEHMALDAGPSDFNSLLTYSLVLRAKPDGWEKTAKKILEASDRSSIYLRYMLGSSLRQFNQEVNTSSDRTSLKRIVANIQAKRHIKKANPNNKAIDHALKALELSNYFEKSKKIQEITLENKLPSVEAEAKKLLESNVVGLAVDQSDPTPGEGSLFKNIDAG